MAVGPGPPGWPLLVPSQWCVPPEAVVTLCPSVVTEPSNVVLVGPSTRSVTAAGAPSAGAAAAADMSRAAGRARRPRRETRCIMDRPFLEGPLCGRQEV